MDDLIIVGILAAIVVFALLAAAKRLRRRASCCSGSDYTAKSRRLKSVIRKVSFRVEGMHCQNCVNRVMENIQDIPHTSAAVDLRKGTVTVSLEEDTEDKILIAAIEKGGYKVVCQKSIF